MADIRVRREAAADRTRTGRKPQQFAPAGQSTQVIVGADGATDETILRNSVRLYSSYQLKRVYYSAFSPIPDASKALPLIEPPLQREHRLYQADWLLRFYGFDVAEVASVTRNGNLDLDIEPKLAWALAHRDAFPVEVNKAAKEMLLRVPGFGLKTVDRILSTRRQRTVRYGDLKRMGASLQKARPFITVADWKPGALTDDDNLRIRFAPPPQQLKLV